MIKEINLTEYAIKRAKTNISKIEKEITDLKKYYKNRKKELEHKLTLINGEALLLIKEVSNEVVSYCPADNNYKFCVCSRCKKIDNEKLYIFPKKGETLIFAVDFSLPRLCLECSLKGISENV